MSNLCINWRFGAWFFQVEGHFPFRVRVNRSGWWSDKYERGERHPPIAFYNTFGLRTDP